MSISSKIFDLVTVRLGEQGYKPIGVIVNDAEVVAHVPTRDAGTKNTISGASLDESDWQAASLVVQRVS